METFKQILEVYEAQEQEIEDLNKMGMNTKKGKKLDQGLIQKFDELKAAHKELEDENEKLY